MRQDGKLPEGFAEPTSAPREPEARSFWQRRNRAWWESSPMCYDWRDPIGAPEFSREFFLEIDRRFFADSARYAPPRTRNFDQIIPFEDLGQKDVLEIGVGNGSHAQLLMTSCRRYTGIDITDYAVHSTRRRIDAFSLRGSVAQMDAEMLAFEDRSFDFVWSWGVIHHTADTRRALSEIHRVLRPGGRATIMVYHRSFLYYYLFNGVFRGLLGGGFLRAGSLHELVQRHTDGAIARFYRASEWRALINEAGFNPVAIEVRGQKSELFPLPASRFKEILMRLVPDAVCRLLLNMLRQGSFLISTVEKPLCDAEPADG